MQSIPPIYITNFANITFGKKSLACSPLPAAMIGKAGLKDEEGDGETKILVSMIGCKGREGKRVLKRPVVGCSESEGESKVERPVVGCSKSDETEAGKRVTGCGYLVGSKSNSDVGV